MYMGMSYRWIRLTCTLTTIIFGIAASDSRRRKKTSSEWRSVEWDNVEKDWEEGDDSIELRTEDQEEFDRLQARRDELDRLGATEDLMNDPDAAIHHSSRAGPTMMFAKIQTKGPDDEIVIERKDVEEMGQMWSDKLFIGGVKVTTYTIEDDTVLVTLQHGWNGMDLLEFLVTQPKVIDVTWDGKAYDVEALTEMKRRRRRMKRKKRKKKRRAPSRTKIATPTHEQTGGTTISSGEL